MKRTLLSILVIALLVAAGLGGWVLLGQSPAEASNSEHPPAAANGKRFVKLNPFMLPVVGKRRVEQMVGLVVALELEDPARASLVEENSPKLTDAFISDLYGVLEPSRLSEAGLVDIDQVKTKLARASSRILGEGIVKEVLVQMVSQRAVSH